MYSYLISNFILLGLKKEMFAKRIIIYYVLHENNNMLPIFIYRLK